MVKSQHIELAAFQVTNAFRPESGWSNFSLDWMMDKAEPMMRTMTNVSQTID